MQGQNYIPLMIAIGCFVMLGMALTIILFVARHQRKMFENKQRIQDIENEKQIALFKASLEAEERQKEIIARNLHDGINPMLSYLKLSLTQHQSDFLTNKFSHEDLNKDKTTIENISREIRSTCHDLIPSILNDMGLIHALEDIIDVINRSKLAQAEYNFDRVDTDFTNVSKIDQVNIYRVCQELINNILKHANCNQLFLRAYSHQQKLCIELSYNGQGITDTELELLSKKGLGLNSLKTRVLVLNATLNYLRGENAFEIKFHVPIAA